MDFRPKVVSSASRDRAAIRERRHIATGRFGGRFGVYSSRSAALRRDLPLFGGQE